MAASQPELYYIGSEEFLRHIEGLATKVTSSGWTPDFIIGIGRGGLVPAVYLSHRLAVPMLSVDHSSKVAGFAEELLSKVAEKSAAGTRLLFVDDINDSGGTIEHIRRLLAQDGCDDNNLRFAVSISNTRSKVWVDYWSEMIDRQTDKRWFVFPWEAVASSFTLVEDALSVPERLA